MIGGRFFVIKSGVSPGHVLKKLFFIAVVNVVLTGDKHVACKYLARSACVCFFFIITANDGFCGSMCTFKYFLSVASYIWF